jgi:predicted metal-binding membrane protein
MLPSAAPAILLFTALRQQARYSGAALFTGGYLACWAAFSLVATSAQWLLARAELLASPMMIQASSGLAASLFVVAGFYQLTPWKTACLARCRAPAEFFAAHWRPGKLAAFWLGARHGLYCIGCCWALMALLFAVGVMNLLWVAALAAFVFVEKLFPGGERIARLSAVALIGTGLAFLWFDDGGFHGSMGNQGNGIH